MAKLKTAAGMLLAWCADWLQRESRRVGQFIERNLRRMILLWAALALLGGTARILLLVGQHPGIATIERLAPLGTTYLLAAFTPLIAYLLVQKSFPKGAEHSQPRIRLARLGRWSDLAPGEAHRISDPGLSGLLVSVVAGILLCLVIRLAEYFLAVPAIPAGAPAWATTFFWMMTFDLVFLVFLYSTAVAMALNGAPLFPRLLAYAWLCDVLMQLAIARTVTNAGPLPAEVIEPLQSFLVINTKKVLISAAIWLPYLLLSTRINAVFRRRVSKPGTGFPQFA